ncbi:MULTISPECIES: FAD-dependent monooxygenase [Ramlibacter]|uniref:FAD-dependent oxidoreductase n=1 Tax=Ramlibacter pinisoli TaxID=2682844 RepID=A0A6N8J364_9BURK|nr:MULTISPECIES: FAD-dependent monooxygenase [Ramlibacter]MBA2962761.1 FAD-dependent monooxygenase [Ramlibacter sp. CGMCC 1.13660]MVQ32703.1 FAD-dependent oxidoreductase [Ramlibacter pinisoli]
MDRPGPPLPSRVPVLIAGGGPVGLTCAALLARHGIATLVMEADAGYCSGSRAICISRRSQEILHWAGAGAALQAKALPWTGGRSYFRDREVLRFEMPHEPAQRFAPMVNIQQYHVEQFVHQALAGMPAQVAWSHRVSAVRQDDDGVVVQAAGPDGEQELRADWLVACDGGRSTVREQLGLALEGTQYEGRYVIADIVQATQRPVERLAWFDPPSNPGSTLLMHRQPDDVWRIDYQLRDDEDAQAALAPAAIEPRIQSHLTMIGEHAPWRMLWSSMYNAKCLTLRDYRHGRVLFAGDAAHLVPIFGVRGLNSGLDDAGNLAWKLAAVLQGRAHERLLDSYSVERVQATRENLAYGAKSTEFMAPPNFAFTLMRDAALRLALDEPRVRALINPRQSAPIAYAASPLNGPEVGAWTSAAAAPGAPAPEALLLGEGGEFHLSTCFGAGWVALVLGGAGAVARSEVQGGWTLLQVPDAADHLGQARQRYGLPGGAGARLVLVRPDGYVCGRWDHVDLDAARRELASRGVQP